MAPPWQQYVKLITIARTGGSNLSERATQNPFAIA
jgi:hypothetical protein